MFLFLQPLKNMCFKTKRKCLATISTRKWRLNQISPGTAGCCNFQSFKSFKSLRAKMLQIEENSEVEQIANDGRHAKYNFRFPKRAAV